MKQDVAPSSPATERRKMTIRRLQRKKAERESIVALGVYESVTATLADDLSIDIFMTGPSGPMSLFGHSDPTQISFDEQLCTLRAVSRVTRFALINAHMPFLAYQTSERDAVINAGRLVAEGGADCVKVDAHPSLARNIQAIVDAGIPVMAHLGVQALRRTEQSGYSLKAATAESAKELIETAQIIAATGVSAFLLEHVCADVCELIAHRVRAPVISLGSGARADGVCIVAGDLINYSAVQRPAHAGRMVDVNATIEEALTRFASSVRDQKYPDAAHAPQMSEEEWGRFNQLLASATTALHP